MLNAARQLMRPLKPLAAAHRHLVLWFKCLANRHQWQPRPGTQAEMDGQYVDVEGCANCAAWRPATQSGWDSRWWD